MENSKVKFKLFNWSDFKHFDVAPETLAEYCNQLLEQRTSTVSLDRHGHDVVRNDVLLPEVLDQYPLEARMTQPRPKNKAINDPQKET